MGSLNLTHSVCDRSSDTLSAHTNELLALFSRSQFCSVILCESYHQKISTNLVGASTDLIQEEYIIVNLLSSSSFHGLSWITEIGYTLLSALNLQVHQAGEGNAATPSAVS